MFRVQRIDHKSELYPQALDLRQRAVLEPLGLTLDDFHLAFPGFEERLEHIVATIDHPQGERVIGCVSLLADHPTKGTGRLMQMAVDPQRRREGVGRRLLAEFERRALGELGLTTLLCHAHQDARSFYERMGWRVEGDAFDEAGVPHYRMEFRP